VGASTDFSCTFTPLATTAWTATGHGTDALGNDVPTTYESTSGTIVVAGSPGPGPGPGGLVVVSGLDPASRVAGGSSFTLTVSGTNFSTGSIVIWNGQPLDTTFINATQLTASVPANLIPTPGSATVSVSLDGVASLFSKTFTIVPPPVIT
jgi:hypothetical protein